ncbi:hypothetical protein [Salmonella enterica]
MKKFLRIKTWFVRLFSPDKKTLGAIGEDLRKVAVTAIGVGIVGVVSENGIYGHSRFCNTDFDDKLACLNLSGVNEPFRFTGSSTGRWAVSIINISIRKTR